MLQATETVKPANNETMHKGNTETVNTQMYKCMKSGTKKNTNYENVIQQAKKM